MKRFDAASSTAVAASACNGDIGSSGIGSRKALHLTV
jgi:hypothetical protein